MSYEFLKYTKMAWERKYNRIDHISYWRPTINFGLQLIINPFSDIPVEVYSSCMMLPCSRPFETDWCNYTSAGHQKFRLRCVTCSVPLIYIIYRWHVVIWSLGEKFNTILINTMIARFMGPTWGPSGADRTQVGPMFAPCYLGIHNLFSRKCSWNYCW